jgi:uncharacterized protein YecA (UPF0149 family)
MTGEGEPIFVWLQQCDQQIDWVKINNKASSASLACKTSNLVGVFAEVDSDGTYHLAQSFAVHIPIERTVENASIYEDAARMAHPKRTLNLKKLENVIPIGKTNEPGRNDPCPCGSGAKYKRCHGR